jgi:ubiquitin-conjugating enzyme E2 Q
MEQIFHPEKSDVPFVALDPNHPLTLSHKLIEIPQPSYKLEKLLAERMQEFVEEEYDEADALIFAPQPQQSVNSVIEVEDTPELGRQREGDRWTHDPEWVSQTVEHLMPPPVEATPTATMALQRELKSMLKEQERAKSISDLGWYMPPEFIGDNLFQWIVELHSFDNSLPIAQDLVARYISP